jgi:peptidyl-prolyl cis-trans isomerase D
MLANIRAFTQSPYAIVLIGLIILSFAVWGVSGIFTGSGTAVVVIGQEQVSVRELADGYEREIQTYQQQEPGFTREDARARGVGNQVLQRLIVQSALVAKANEMGIAISDDALLDYFAEFDAFRNPATGRYDYDTMLQVLNSNRQTEAQFLAGLRSDLLRSQLIDAMVSGVSTPPMITDTRYLVMEEQRQMRALILDPSTADTIEDPTDEQLQELIDNNPAMVDANRLPIFMAPEFRAVSLVRFRLEDFMLDVDVDETVLREIYDYQVESGALGTPAVRGFLQIVAGDAVTAQIVADRLSAGEDADIVATELGLGAPFINDDVQSYQVPDGDLADAVFAMATGASAAVEGNFGWYAVQITSGVDATMPTFEDRLPELRAEAARAEALDQMYDHMAAFEEARSDGLTLEEAAGRAQIPAETYLPLDQFARDNSGEIDFARYTSLGPDILQTAFEQVPGFEIDVQQYNETDYFTVRVDEVISERPRRLDEVRDIAETRWRDLQVNTQLRERMEAALEQLEAGDDMDVVALLSGGRVETATLRRTETAAPFDRSVVGQAFSQTLGEYRLMPPSDAPQHVIVVVDEVITADVTEAPASELTSIRDSISEEFSNDILEQVQSALYAEYEISDGSIDLRLRAQALGETDDFVQ